SLFFFFFFQAEDGIRAGHVTGVQTCALPISCLRPPAGLRGWSPTSPSPGHHPRRPAGGRRQGPRASLRVPAVQAGTASKTGEPSGRTEVLVSWITPVPSAFMTKISSSPPSRVLWNAICLPSGDQTGSSSTKPPEV